MIIKLLLDKKREGHALAEDEIRELVAAYTKGDVPDYQMAAFAMAVCCKGMNAAETHALTDAMMRSGACLSWEGLSADKHSTGGIGDKLSLIIQPLAASCGLSVPSLAGRGLGLTGGTVDKLESIPGYNACLPLADFQRVVATCGLSIAAQTAEIAPADKKLYALRDVTGTVPSIPLIVGSILSKKLAEGAGTLVFDVKCGTGAFMKTRADATALAQALVAGAKAAGRKAAALVTAMDEPLGLTVGNALEVREAIDVLKGAPEPKAVIDLSVELAALMVSLAKGIPLDEARAACRANLANGAAYARFAEMVKLHGGDLVAFDDLLKVFKVSSDTKDSSAPSDTKDSSDPSDSKGAVACMCVAAPRAGHVARIDAEGVAQVAFELGAGRTKSSDAIDPLAGVELCVTRGDRVEQGQPLARLFTCTRADRLDAVRHVLCAAVSLAAEPPSAQALILERID